jgi:uncharacterized protein (TIGR03435 family)
MCKEIAILLLSTVAAVGQSFEVASVKPSRADAQRGSDGGPGSKDPVNYHFNSATLLDLIAIGYDVEYSQISSKSPLDNARFDLQSKVPAGATKDDFRGMMRALLAERFHLKAHTETREFPGFELIVAKNGPRMPNQPAHSLEGFPQTPEGRPGLAINFSTSGGYSLMRLRAQQQTMDALALALRRFAGDMPNSFVVNHTGLPGAYDFTLEFTRENRRQDTASMADPPVAPALFTAMQEQLGLRLVSAKVRFPVVVVESVDKLPTEN